MNEAKPTEWFELFQKVQQERDEARAEAARLKAHRDTIWRSANVLHQAIAVFLKDWKDGDFGLPTLARIHVLSIEEKYCELGKALSAKEKTK